MDQSIVAIIAMRELRSALRNRWFILYSVVFLLLIVGFSWIAFSSVDLAGQSGFGRTSAGLLNLLLLVVPLIGLTIGAQAIVSAHQERSLDYLLAQPVSPIQVFAGKYLGGAASIVLILILGFSWSALVIALRGTGGNLGDYVVLMVLTILLGLAMLSVGFLISSFSTQTSTALAIAVTLWLIFVVIGDLGLIGSSLVLGIRPETLFAMTVINPLDTYKIASVEMLHTSLDVLGPAGIYATDRYGDRLLPLLLLFELLWVLIPLPIGYWLFKRTSLR